MFVRVAQRTRRLTTDQEIVSSNLTVDTCFFLFVDTFFSTPWILFFLSSWVRENRTRLTRSTLALGLTAPRESHRGFKACILIRMHALILGYTP